MTLELRVKRLEQNLPKTTGNAFLDRFSNMDFKKHIEIDRYIYFNDNPLTGELKEIKDDFEKLPPHKQGKLLRELKRINNWDKYPLWLFQLLDIDEGLFQ